MTSQPDIEVTVPDPRGEVNEEGVTSYVSAVASDSEHWLGPVWYLEPLQ